MRSTRIIAVTGVLAYCALAAMPAFAHAELIRSNPPSNALLDSSPKQIELLFTETIAPELSTVAVLDTNGDSVNPGRLQIDPNDATRVTVALPPLEDGVYTVAWRVISAVDGHPTSGTFPFAVGTQNAAAIAGESPTSGSQLPASALAYKWLLYASLALVAGEFAFMWLVWRPAADRMRGELPVDLAELRQRADIREWASVALLGGLGLSILSQLGLISGSGLAVPWSAGASQLLLASRLGLIWLARAGLALVIVWLMYSAEAGWRSWARFAAGLLLLLTLSLEAHAATGSRPVIPVLADWIHLAGMSFWLGGLPFLLIAVLGSRQLSEARRTKLLSMSIQRFSAMAVTSVGAVGITGIYAASLHLGPPETWTGTSYGQAMLAKQIFVGLLMVVAAANLLWFSPRIQDAAEAGGSAAAILRRFRKSVSAEIGFGALLLASVSVVTTLPPARPSLPYEILQTNTARDLRMVLDIVPGTLGYNSFNVHLSSGGKPVEQVDTALLRFNSLSHDVPQFDGRLQATGGGDYAAEGNYLSLTGRWQVLVVVRRANEFDAIAYFHFTLPTPTNKAANQHRRSLGMALLAVDACLAAFALRSVVMRGVSSGDQARARMNQPR